MSLLDFVKNIIKGFLPQKSYLDEFSEKRKRQKEMIGESLKGLNFTEMERNEVLNIIDRTDNKISVLKAKLIGTNITTGENLEYPDDFIEHVMAQIKAEQENLDSQMRAKIQEILERKKKS